MKYSCINRIMPEHCTGYTEEILVCKYDDGDVEVTWSHCGNGVGCFWTEPEDITNTYHDLGMFQILQSLKKEGFSIYRC